jgi:hypothetical protein
MYNGKYNLIIKQDKCLDIVRAEYAGENLAFISKHGSVSSALCNSGAFGFANGFDGGFLYTCGLDNVGAPAERNGRLCVQHGSISQIPAENVSIEYGEKDGRWFVSVGGEMRYTALFGSKLILRRKITLGYLSDEILLEDTVRNDGFADDEYMLLYHFNVGYPLLCENTSVSVSSVESTDFANDKSRRNACVSGIEKTAYVSDKARRNACVSGIEKTAYVNDKARCNAAVSGIEKTAYVSDKARRNAAAVFRFEKPSPKTEEEVFVHTLRAERQIAAVSNGRRTAEFCFDGRELPYLVQWKSAASGDYALGIEPSTVDLTDRKPVKIPAGDSHRFNIKIRLNDKV